MTTTLRTAPSRRRWITDWRPDDPSFWREHGRRVAVRNLVFSIFSEHLAFSVWLLMSAVAVSLPAAGFAFTVDQLFWLVAIPNLVGGLMRIPYTTAVARFGGRQWTVVSSVLLLVPLGLLTYAIATPGTPYWVFLAAAVTAGLGGGNFASSMASISYFFPERAKGLALGLNAAGGNVGVAVVQFAVPAVIGVGVLGAAQGEGLWLHNAPLLWVVPVVAATICAWAFMDNLSTARTPLRQQVQALRSRHAWIIAALYIGTFGSFIGYSAAFPLVIRAEFPDMAATWLAALGPLVGSASRPVGGWLSDRLGGARVTSFSFAAMGLGTLAAMFGLAAGSFPLFFGAFLLLFVFSGAGNGSTFRMIPAVFRAEAGSAPTEAALARARARAAAVIGFASAIGALGGFLIPRGFGSSLAATGSIDTALWVFLAAYAACLALTWWSYQRKPGAPAV
ncbi:MFS transporter [Phytomonospora endophytica]|uniref:NNP family nitrate/nitrite transporter-like MFS transporter n=1 Tax=Phytomonospora endophytica TaxID=714109 RepID=A0A841F7Z4_9ACTN|nr:MFS transporter [Phytomonospora endophytica]MBB6033171.1 NNP family nitrate/nitrite transporter-like MFS transporter [Phytomonospora endophytica]GIG65397.1 MFS transporter [Phytomonospora endophytica]